MEFYYRKVNSRIVSNLENIPSLEVSNVQNYIPIYQRLLKLNEQNHNGVVLNSHYELTKILKDDDDDDDDPHFVFGEIKMCSKRGSAAADTVIKDVPIFIKFSPLLDPIKYLSGKYDITDDSLMALPQYGSTKNTCHSKVLDYNNSAYVDGFFTYLSSGAMHAHKFCHGVEYYGSHIAHKQNFEVNITDDLECFQECGFFKSNNNIIYNMDSNSTAIYENSLNYLYEDARNTNASLRGHKPKLICGENSTSGDDVEITIDTFDDTLHTLFDSKSLIVKVDPTVRGDDAVVVIDKCNNRSQLSHSSNSSRSSNSSTPPNDTDGAGDGAGDDEDDWDDDEDDEIYVTIKKFPVNMIVMEQCDDTLDSMLEDGVSLSTDEWTSILMQIIMTLVAYQKMFWFTHNDLHTNNVMYVETDKPYLYYLYDGTYYKVPTYGKIFKIIDFGRAVYKYKSLTICSDSFHPKGDAATQYNFEPYMNNKKPRLEPNPSFDLCRLACSLFDFFIQDVSAESALATNDPIIALVTEWVKDDKGRNVLYKSNGVERYPNFKLYKMIARTVHGHVPAAQLSNPLFSKYAVLGSEISQKVKKTALMSIDDMPEYYV